MAMKVFVTGATGYIGNAIVHALIARGYSVIALARSASSEGALRPLGVEVLRGSIAEREAYESTAAGCDAAIHAAFDQGPDAVKADRAAIDALLAAARRQKKIQSLIFTSGVWVLGNTGEKPATESSPIEHPPKLVSWRPAHERQVLEATAGALKTAVLRPGIVYGEKRGLISPMFEQATKEGFVEFVGDGKNHWSFIHREDLAALYATIIEKQGAGVFHGVDDQPVRLANAAAAISKAAGRGGATRSLPAERARQKIGPLVDAFLLDQRVSAPRSRELGWKPTRESFLKGVVAAYDEWRG